MKIDYATLAQFNQNYEVKGRVYKLDKEISSGETVSINFDPSKYDVDVKVDSRSSWKNANQD